MRIPTPHGSVHVELAGPAGAPVLLFLHAFPLSGAMWSAQVEAFQRDWRVVVPDFRGFGGSDPGDGQYSLDFYVDDLFAVLDAPALAPLPRPAAACGCSMGGYVLLRALERERSRFGALVLADTKSAADDNEGKIKRFAAVRALKEHGAAEYAKGFAAAALGPTTRAQHPEVSERVQELVRANSVLGMAGAQLAMAARTDTTAGLRELSIPTLVVVGAEDALTPPDAARDLAAHIPGACLEVIQQAGHLTPLEAPEAFNGALKGFLEPALLGL